MSKWKNILSTAKAIVAPQTKSIEVTLDWPPAALNPNKRVHWSVKAKATKAYRESCGWLARQQAHGFEVKKTMLHFKIYPPDRRERDKDNVIASLKAAQDGIADALGVNDKYFDCTYEIVDELGGMIKVRIEQ